ncbi:MAG TPA: carboxypeptidase-like regulatory domain-containing protein [Kofleriaceae bacterium]|nr:carboxypeptidase-like regulatory domain-containing protein [Kofleriaceae bacterium]
MNRVLVLGCVLLATACGSKSFGSLCDNQVPPPAACNTACDPKPGAANTCPAGYFCSADGACDAQCTPTGGQCGDGYSCTTDGRCVGGDTPPCQGLQCQVTDCEKQGMPATTITGTVFAPNGSLPLFGVSVYVPNVVDQPLPPFQDGVTCGSCSLGLPGNPVVSTVTDDQGKFSLVGVPNGASIPVVITIGKWRRQLKIANVASCASQALEPADTRLPAARDDMTPNTTSVDLPQIAISTGNADSLECLVRRLGIKDKEITTNAPAGTASGRIHLYSDNGAGGGKGVASFEPTFGGGTGALADSADLWGDASKSGTLNNYDIVILSCEGAQHAETKSQAAMDHLKAYADIGGRVFLSHWHNIWLEGSTQDTTKGTQAPKVWADQPNPIAKFDDSKPNIQGAVNDTIDEVNNPKGMAFANWMLTVQKNSPMRGQVAIAAGTARDQAIFVDTTRAERWVYLQSGADQFPQNFQFTTPLEADQAARCGKVVFSDMHVSGGPVKNNGVIPPYPTSCGDAATPADLSDQEKALAFMFFDISSCVGVLF